jgi:membrane protein YqaA with SNARE-associated domain
MKHTALIQKIVVGVCILGALVFFNLFALSNDTLRSAISSFGLLGVFVVAVLSGFNLIVPVPAIGFFPLYQELGFSTISTIVVISLGMVIGDGIGFFLGRIGRDMVAKKKEHRVMLYISNLQKKHRLFPYIALGIYATFVPLPNELLVIPMAFAGYSFLPMAVALFFGNIVFNVLGAFGIQSVISLFV